MSVFDYFMVLVLKGLMIKTPELHQWGRYVHIFLKLNEIYHTIMLMKILICQEKLSEVTLIFLLTSCASNIKAITNSLYPHVLHCITSIFQN